MGRVEETRSSICQAREEKTSKKKNTTKINKKGPHLKTPT